MDDDTKQLLRDLAKQDPGAAAIEGLMRLRDRVIETQGFIRANRLKRDEAKAFLAELHDHVLNTAGIIDSRVRRKDEVESGW